MLLSAKTNNRFAPRAIFAAVVIICFLGTSWALAATESSLRNTIKQEEAKAKNRRDSLKLLTDEEKTLNLDLAASEKSILELEKKLAEQRSQLSGLASASEAVQKDYDKLQGEQQKTERALSELLSTLWGVYTRRASIGGRNLESWPSIDREYYWTADLLKAIGKYQDELQAQERELAEIIGKRDTIGQEINLQMSGIEQQKTQLLQERIKHEQRLASVRKQRQSAESELQDTLRLIEDLNFDLKNLRQEQVSIDKAKGKLPWPTNGKIVQKFRPSGNNPIRGVGFATSGMADVRAVHAGKVMFRDTMRGLGLVVVLQHGQDYFSIYAFLSDSAVSLGQNVNRGQTLGRCGYYPAIQGNGLYFELRHHQQALNPESWLAKSG